MTPVPGTIFCDLDGTLLRSDDTVSRRTRAAVRAVVGSGWHFVIATGRPVRDCRAVVDALGHRGHVICGNGSLVYDFDSESVVDSSAISAVESRRLMDAVRTAHADVVFGVENGLDLFLEPAFRLDTTRFLPGVVMTDLVEGVRSRGCTKVIAQLAGDARTYVHRLAACVSGFEVTVSGRDFCEITLAGTTKAAAAARLVHRYGSVPERALVFGDMVNDLPLFEWAGRSVAVANADPVVLRAATEVTASNDEDGVARYLESLLAPQPQGPYP